MDPTYQQTMIQALMGQGQAAPGTTGQNATTSYGQGFMTGNMMNPAGTPAYGGQNQTANQTSSGLNSTNSLTNGPSTQLLQPYSTY